MRRHYLRGYDEEESNDEVYNSKYDSSTEIDLDFEERDNVENKCFICRDTQTFSMNRYINRILKKFNFSCAFKALAFHTITPAVGEECRCKAKAGLWRSPRGLQSRPLLRLNLGSSLKTTWFHSTAVQFPRGRHHFKRRRRWVGVKGNTHNGCFDPKCASAGHLRMVRSEGATCAWMAADEAVGCTRAFLTMRWSSRRLVFRGCPEPGLRVNDISRIH
ncbi:UNVERIFIED_CONTAM: hypothetical protein NCL1_14237 [Trichonephila clavipes]